MRVGGFKVGLVAVCLLLGGMHPTRADLLVDVDPFTPGIQTSLSVLSGASVTVVTYFSPVLSGPLAFNGFAIDLNWGAVGSATATPTTPAIAGSIAPFAPGRMDIASTATPIMPGMPLASAGAPPSGAPFSIGGAGLVDLTSSVFGMGGPIGAPVDFFGVTFTISGAPGEFVTFTPSGLLVPGLGATPGSGPFVPGGAPYQVGFTSPTPTIPDTAFSSIITIIPEPSAVAYGVIGLALLACRLPRARGRTRRPGVTDRSR